MTDDKPIPFMRLPSLQREDRSAVMERAEQREAERLAAVAAGDELPALTTVRLLGFTSTCPKQREADRKAAAAHLVARLPVPPPTRAVGESIRPRIGDELGPTSLDTEVLDMTDDTLRRMAYRRLALELDDTRETMKALGYRVTTLGAAAQAARQTKLRQAERIWDLEAQVTELRARDMSIVGAVVRTLRERLRGDR